MVAGTNDKKWCLSLIYLKKLALGILIFLLLAKLEIFAQEEKPKEKLRRTSIMKEIQGEVVFIAKDRIALLYRVDETGQNEEEILFYLPKDIKLVYKQKLSEIAMGDIVSVQYEEVTETSDTGTNITLKAKSIIFVKKGAKKPRQVGAAVPETLLDTGKE